MDRHRDGAARELELRRRIQAMLDVRAPVGARIAPDGLETPTGVARLFERQDVITDSAERSS